MHIAGGGLGQCAIGIRNHGHGELVQLATAARPEDLILQTALLELPLLANLGNDSLRLRRVEQNGPRVPAVFAGNCIEH